MLAANTHEAAEEPQKQLYLTWKLRRSICALSSAMVASRSARRASCASMVSSRAVIVSCRCQ
jgi:hypothetical protein